MKNQHRKIKGYRELTENEITRMNDAEQLEEDVMRFIDLELTEDDRHSDPRWLAIAKTDIQKGFMALGRAIARPDGY